MLQQSHAFGSDGRDTFWTRGTGDLHVETTKQDVPSLPASCSWIFSISMGVVMTTWHMPAPQPASISLSTVSPLLPDTIWNESVSEKERARVRDGGTNGGVILSYPSLLR